MTYTAPGAATFRRKGGDLDKKICDQLALIDTQLDTDTTALGLRAKIGRITLAGGAADAIAGSWQNPESVAIAIEKVVCQITTAGGTATAVLDIGAAANATTGSDNLIDGADANAVAVYDNITNKGSNGKTTQILDANGGATDYITAQIKTEAAAALKGTILIFYGTLA